MPRRENGTKWNFSAKVDFCPLVGQLASGRGYPISDYVFLLRERCEREWQARVDAMGRSAGTTTHRSSRRGFSVDSGYFANGGEKRDLVRIATWLTLWQPPPGRQLPDYNVKVLKVVKRWQGHKALIAGSPLSRQAPLTSCEVWADAPVRETRPLTLYLDGIIFSLAAYPSSRRSAYNSRHRVKRFGGPKGFGLFTT